MSLLCTFFFVSVFLQYAYASAQLSFDNQASINHYRSHPIYTANGVELDFVRHSTYDKNDYLWLSSGVGILRYDGYALTGFPLQHGNEQSSHKNNLLFADSNGHIWVGSAGLQRFNYKTEQLDFLDYTQGRFIHSMIEDGQGQLWLTGEFQELVGVDKDTGQVIKRIDAELVPNLPSRVFSTTYDQNQNKIWMIVQEGLAYLDLDTLDYRVISTVVDGLWKTFYIRDMSFDSSHNALWIGTSKGLLRVNTKNETSRIYKAQNAPNQLPISDVTTTFIDSHGNVWAGLEKEGVCLYRYAKDNFLCLKPQIDTEHRLPPTTIEDISEDGRGNIWFAMNNYGLYRVTPELEKIQTLKYLFNESVPDYFAYSFDGETLENGEVWIATDGGGINIFNRNTGNFRNIKHVNGDPNTLKSNSIVSMTKDENDNIWVGTWTGGLSMINPNTMDITTYQYDLNKPSNETLLTDNIFVVEADKNGGIWLSSWGLGLQHFNFKTQTFTNYVHTNANGDSPILNFLITHMQLFDNKLFMSGNNGLDVLDIETGEFRVLFDSNDNDFTYVHVESWEEIWLGSKKGVFKINGLTLEYQQFTENDGLSNNEVNYITKVDDQVWIATNHGLSILNTHSGEFTNLYKKDGLASDKTSAHAEFIFVDDLVYVPNRKGVNIIDPLNIPSNNEQPKTVITSILATTADEDSHRKASDGLTLQQNVRIDFAKNNIRFDFASLSFVFPEENQFKYRLKGWRDSFEYTSAEERFVRYTNLNPGKYEFEVYSSNSNGIWDPVGASFSFQVQSPWWKKWWAFVLYIVAGVISVQLILRWRLAMNLQREKELQIKVEEKTEKLEEYTRQLSETSQSLEVLNQELEARVEERTAELKIEIDERKLAESKLYHLAFYDSLTGIANRESIIKLVNSLLERTRAEPCFKFAVMFLDGDRFKDVNDTLGHLVGDKLLIASSLRLQKLLFDDTQHVGRLGGDEFTVIIEHSDKVDIVELAGTLVKEFDKPFYIDNSTINFKMSVGVVECDKSYMRVPDVLKSADIAMYQAKESGKGTFKFFDQEMQRRIKKAHEIENSIQEGIALDQFYLEFQPIVNLKAGVLEGFEALIRWNHPEYGYLPPDQFIPIAEETGLIWNLGKWALLHACYQAKTWHERYPDSKISISVNLSTHQLRNERFLSMVDSALEQSDLEPKYLKLELTETLLIENRLAFRDVFTALQKRNIGLALDDFGTGYSSLAYLNQIPFQILKIDRSFVSSIENDNLTAASHKTINLVQSTISLGKNLGKKLTAEGIETEYQMKLLLDFGCDYAQGYLFSKPVKKQVAEKMVENPEYFKELILHAKSIKYESNVCGK